MTQTQYPANWYIVIDLSTRRPVYGGPDQSQADRLFGDTKHAYYAAQHRPQQGILRPTRCVWERIRGGPDGN